MSWLSLSLPNPFKSPTDQNPTSSSSPQPHPPTPPPSDPTPSPTVKEDLSVLTQTLGHQLRGFASFLAPLPSPSPPHSSTTASSSPSQTLVGIKNDLVEIGGSFKTRLSLLSSNNAVTEISRFASNFLQFEDEGDDEDEEAVGITEEVLDFVREISLRPECWTDFPLALHNDFDMSDSQREHAATVEQLVPNLAALRHKICSYLSEEQFWMIYFILLLPRLNENDSKLLSTPEIVEVREILLQKLHKKNDAPVEISGDCDTVDAFQEAGNLNSTQEIKSPTQGNEVLVEVINAAQGLEIGDHENTERWLEEEDVDTCTSVDAQKESENQEDISFSDLDDDDNDLSGRLSGFRPAQIDKVSSSRSESNEWVQLNENLGILGGRQKTGDSTSREKDSEGEEWLTVDDIDF